MWKRTDVCGHLNEADVGRKVALCGWVHRRRDHGGVIFVDLRDRSGLVQIVFNPTDCAADSFRLAETLRSEFVIYISGEVRRRLAGMENPKLASGSIEVFVEQLEVISLAETPPISVESEKTADVEEAMRLRYRYLDLRRPELQRVFALRHRVGQIVRNHLDAQGFWEVETPMLTRSTPEGARDFLVPSRLQPGEFYALPQSPQLFKQLLMVSGFERYFQIARCFRDEDLRADRQPEFTQIDLEMSFVTREDVMEMVEGLVKDVVREVTGEELLSPLPQLTYSEAMDRFGSDKPDLRFGMELKNVSDVVHGSDFQVFNKVLDGGGVVKGVAVPEGASFPRSRIDALTKRAIELGAKGLAWAQYTEEEIKSPIAKFFSESVLEEILVRMEAQRGDLLIWVADSPQVANHVLGQLRLELAQELGLLEGKPDYYLWVVDFPLVEYAEDEERYVAVHHPFTAPLQEDVALLESDPGKVRSAAYDLVLNGVEVGGGSIRIHDRTLQQQMFKLLGISKEAAEEKFGFLLEAFRFGVPPHGGFAFGFDRWIMLLAGISSIRECIAFPKTQKGTCLLTKAPSPVDQGQLDEVGIRIAPKVKP